MPSSDVQSTVPPSVFVNQLQGLDPSSPGSIKLLKSILSKRSHADIVAGLTASQVVTLIDFLDQALDSTSKDSDPELFNKGFRALQKICSKAKILPSSLLLSDGLKKSGELPVASGGFADVWYGTYNGRPVGIKALRIYDSDDAEHMKKIFCKEVVIWKSLSHPNVLKFLGVSTTVFRLCMISEWMSNGNINEYISAHPDANLPKLLSDVVTGLKYLHESKIVHGDLKGPNILVNNQGCACLADFGLTSITSDPLSINASTSGPTHGSARWMAPELLSPDNPDQGDLSKPTEATDIYAFSMVIIEVYNGNVPFHQLRNEVVIFKVMSGMRPDRPINLQFSDEMWGIAQKCWAEMPNQRPKSSELVTYFSRIASSPGNPTAPHAVAQQRKPIVQSTQSSKKVSKKNNSPGIMSRISTFTAKLARCV